MPYVANPPQHYRPLGSGVCSALRGILRAMGDEHALALRAAAKAASPRTNLKQLRCMYVHVVELPQDGNALADTAIPPPCPTTVAASRPT